MALLLLRTLCHDCSSVHWLWQRLRYSMWASVLNVDTEGMCGYVLLTKCTRTIGFRGCCHPTLHLGWAILIRRCILFYTGSAGMNRNRMCILEVAPLLKSTQHLCTNCHFNFICLLSAAVGKKLVCSLLQPQCLQYCENQNAYMTWSKWT